MSSRRQSLPEGDARAIVRLLGQVAGSVSDILSRKKQLMDGLARLVHADGWLWSVTRVKAGVPVCCGLLHDGLTRTQLAAWLESSQVTDPALPEHPACLFDDAGKIVPELTPRRRSVLVMLLNGMSRKEIAHALEISQHIAKDHIEAIYAHYAVDSQIKLVRRLYCGNGGDTH